MTSTGLSTAGAVPVINEKGDVSMVKVKVQRYVSGRVPKYAEEAASSSESDEEFISIDRVKPINRRDEPSTSDEPLVMVSDEVVNGDRRLQRLQRRGEDEDEEDKPHRDVRRGRDRHLDDYESEQSDDEKEEEEVERRHQLILQKRKQEEEELLAKEAEEDSQSEEDEEEEEEEESDYEEYTDSEDETGPRLKPVFVRKKDRLTVQEKQMEELKMKELEIAEKRANEERRKEALRIIEEENKRELLESEKKEEEQLIESIAACNTDDENEEIAYETWKVRELKRIKRDKDEREAAIREKEEIERIRNLTEEERLEEFKKNPKIVTNKAPKGKYKFLQKYYHRGAFYMDQEDDVLKRDYAEPTLEDHFDKTILPKIMQVKNFGRSGRTKYTHLVDQDTTAFDSPWSTENAQTSKFHNIAGGMKQCFERPTKRRK